MDRLDEAIACEDRDIIIDINQYVAIQKIDKNKTFVDDGMVGVNFWYAGGATFSLDIAQSKTERLTFYPGTEVKYQSGTIGVVITGDTYYGDAIKDTDGRQLIYTPAQILIHELISHAIPQLLKEKDGNAIIRENEIRKELGLPLRKIEEDHTVYPKKK